MRARITLTQVAYAADVVLPVVSRVFAGLAKSQHVVDTAKRLLAEHNGSRP